MAASKWSFVPDLHASFAKSANIPFPLISASLYMALL